jgi:hypothetical protein
LPVIIAAIILIYLAFITLPGWLVAILIYGIVFGGASLAFPKRKRRRSKRRPVRTSLAGPTVAYIILKDGYGKFGITVFKGFAESQDVRQRYSNKPIRVLWTKTLPSREAGRKFEAWCKTKVQIIKGREWFDIQDAQVLANKARNYWGS